MLHVIHIFSSWIKYVSLRSVEEKGKEEGSGRRDGDHLNGKNCVTTAKKLDASFGYADRGFFL